AAVETPKPEARAILPERPGRRQLQAASATRLLVVAILLVWLVSLGVGFETGLALHAIVGLVAAVIGLRLPLLGFLGTSMLCTLDAATRVYLLGGGFLRWNTFNYFLLVVMLLGAPVLLRRKDPHTRLLLALLGFLLVELLFTADLLAGSLH